METVRGLCWALAIACLVGVGLLVKFGGHILQAVIVLGAAVLFAAIATSGGRR